MRKTIPLVLLVVVLGLSLALALSLTGGSGGGDRDPGSPSSVQDSAPVRPEAQEPLAKAAFTQPAGNGGPSEGIKVHGHWTIDVREPDGNLVSRREFENDLEQHAGEAISKILGRFWAPGIWEVSLSGIQNICVGTAVGICNIVAVTAVSGETLVLSGSVTADKTGSIGLVKTRIHYCLPMVSPADCAGAGSSGGVHVGQENFSSKSLSTSVAVDEGQIVQVEVIFSFQ